jgi:hypothetical protein
MRDADLMSIYSEEGRQLLLGLSTEFGRPISGMTTHERQDFIEANAAFLRDAQMYTWYGRRIKDLHLESCLREFAKLVKTVPQL